MNVSKLINLLMKWFLLSDISGRELSTSTVNGDFDCHNVYMSEIGVDKLNGIFKLANEDSTD